MKESYPKDQDGERKKVGRSQRYLSSGNLDRASVWPSCIKVQLGCGCASADLSPHLVQAQGGRARSADGRPVKKRDFKQKG